VPSFVATGTARTGRFSGSDFCDYQRLIGASVYDRCGRAMQTIVVGLKSTSEHTEIGDVLAHGESRIDVQSR
jgi:hypothetical protein